MLENVRDKVKKIISAVLASVTMLFPVVKTVQKQLKDAEILRKLYSK